MSAILYVSEAWCLKECEMGILQMTERSLGRSLRSTVQIEKDLQIYMFMLGLNDTIDQLAMAWYGHALRRALDFKVKGQKRKGG